MVLHKVRTIIADVFNVQQNDIQGDSDLLAFGMDSARAMDLVIAIEEAFLVEIPDELMIRLRTANDIVQALETL